MKKLAVVFFAGCLVFLTASAAWAPCLISGYVYCDVNQNGIIDEGIDTPFADVGVLADKLGNIVQIATTDADGYYEVLSHQVCGAIISLDETTLPDDVLFMNPSVNEVTYPNSSSYEQDWLFDSAICHPTVEGYCWLTAGGVKFSPITEMMMAEYRGPKDNVGGNVYPGCNPDSGEGGNWNHLEHRVKLHLKGTDITDVRCGNVDGIPPGSESPDSQFNFIEFEGTGSLVRGSGSNKESFPLVCFYVYAEDRNEPGNERALLPDGGALVDRYFLHVTDCDGNTLYLLEDGDGDPLTVEPITITGGNFQIHPCTDGQ